MTFARPDDNIDKAGGYGGIGRHARFRFWFARVQVQVLLSAPECPYLNPH